MIGAGGFLAGAIFFIGNVIFGGNAQTPANLQTADPGSEIVVPSDDLASDALSLGSDASGDGDSGTQSNSDGDSGAQAPGQSDGSQDDDETAQVPQGLDPRAHVVSVTPYVTGDGRHGFIVGFSEAWDGAPVLYSFFVELVVTNGQCSMTAGHETHAGRVTPLGPGRKTVLDDGTFAFETECPYSSDNVFGVTVRSGSQKNSDSQATFHTIVGPDVPTADATTVDPTGSWLLLMRGHLST